MPNKLIQFSFSGGVFAPEFFGRSDLEKYTLGVRDADNFFVDYRGGASSRPGTELIDRIFGGTAGLRLKKFKFNNRIGNNYILVISGTRLHFVQDGAFVTESNIAYSGIVDGIVSSTAHGLSNGDHVLILGLLYEVSSVSTNAYILLDPQGAVAMVTTGTAGDATKLYGLSFPWAATDLEALVFAQRKNDVVITHPDYPQYVLTRTGHTTWSLGVLSLNPSSIASPTNVSVASSGAGAAEIAYTITAVDAEGNEGYLTFINLEGSLVNYSTTSGHVRFNWDPVPGAVYYRIYRSIIFPAAAGANKGQLLGFIGQTHLGQFVDNNIVPDFSQTPRRKFNPFAPGAVSDISITNVGSGYTGNPTIAVSGAPGSGFSGLPLKTSTGEIRGVMIFDPGSGYVSATATISGGAGSGATATVTLTPATGTYPGAVLFHDQRLWFFGSDNDPIRLWAGRLSSNPFDFSMSFAQTADDPIVLDLDTDEMTPILFAERLNDSMFLFTEQSVWQVTNSDGAYRASARTENGIGLVPPLKIGRELIFSLSEGTGVWAIRPSNLPNYYVDADISLFASHLFDENDPIVSWAYAREPHRLVWAATRSGRLLSLTYVPEQNVEGWMEHSTQGAVRAVEVSHENGIDRIYLAVERAGTVYLERMALRNTDLVESQWSVDAGLTNTLTTRAATLTISGDTCVSSASVFSPSDVGAHIRAGGGRGEVLTYVSATEVTVAWDIPVVSRDPQASTIPVFASTEWTIDQPMLSFSGLDYFEGRTLEIFGDGNDLGTAVVSSGAITLPQAASQVIIGFGFTGFVETLPLAVPNEVIEDRIKAVNQVSVRLFNTRGLQYEVESRRWPMKERTTEPLRAPTRFQNGMFPLATTSPWRIEPSIKLHKIGPYHVTLLSIIFDAQIGDDPG